MKGWEQSQEYMYDLPCFLSLRLRHVFLLSSSLCCILSLFSTIYCLYELFFPSSSPFSCQFSLIPNFTLVIIQSVALPFFFSLFVPCPSHLYSFGSDFPLCASFPVSVFSVDLPFYSPSLYTFFRRFILSSSLLLLKIFLRFLFSLIRYKPFPIYLYLPVFYFHRFSSISLFYSHLS
jgi:hypothetical protein